jgi:hypothetical protein
MSGRLVIHVADGAEAAPGWLLQHGYGVTPVPDDGAGHPRGEPCWHCSDVKLEGMRWYDSTPGGYAEAEKMADQWAGDTGGFASVVEDGDLGRLIVMDGEEAEHYAQAADDIAVIYRADHRPVKP